MDTVYSYIVPIFTKKISTILGFGLICFFGLSMSAIIIFSYSSDKSAFFPGIQSVNADVISPQVEVLQPVSAQKLIFVSLKDQTLVYMEGSKMIGEIKISSGLARTPTPPGEYTVLKKKPLVNYRGVGYNYPRTKWNLMFKTGNPLNYYIHGAFWHNNFGKPMSHGCVNVAYADMEVLYNWADEGTKIIIQASLATLPLALNELSRPAQITMTDISDNSIALSWNAAADPAVAGYQIYMNGQQVSTTSALKYEVSGLNPNTQYQFTVFSYSQSGKTSDRPAELSVTTSKNLAAIAGASTGSNSNTVTIDSSGNITPAEITIRTNDTVNFVYPVFAPQMVLEFNSSSRNKTAPENEFTLPSYKFTSSGIYSYKIKGHSGNIATIIVK